MGISREGQSAEDLFLKATGAARPKKAGSGDALLGDGLVEIKSATKGTLNQVRAVKYIPLVAFHKPTESWYVVPAHVVVALVCGKKRGQHTENPFESATLSLSHLHGYKIPSEVDLRRATLDAMSASSRYPKLKLAMEKTLAEAKDLANRSVTDVRSLLGELGLG